MSGVNPPDADIILRAIESAIGDVWTNTQGRVVAYDAAKMRADIECVSPNKKVRADGTYALETLPVLSDVPVLFPGGAGFSFRWPLAAGSEVLVICTRQSLRAWYDTGRIDADPLDVRTHHLAHALAIPLLGRTPPTVDPDGAVVLECSLVKIGDPAAADFAALASKVDDNFARVKRWLTGWVPVPGDGGAALQAFIAAQELLPPGPAPNSPITPTACAKVKIS